MKWNVWFFIVALCLTATQPIRAQAHPQHTKAAAKQQAEKNAFTPDDVKYGPGPAMIPAGAQFAVLEGNPMGVGAYVARLKVPDGYKVPPHWHPKREHVTVLSGELKLGMGDKFDESKMTSLPAGSFGFLDPSMHHYAMAKGETVLQLHGMGPMKFNYVNPKDNPALAAK